MELERKEAMASFLEESKADVTGEKAGLAEHHLDGLNTPLWIFDIDRSRIAWANRAALDIWQAGSLDELIERDMSGDMSMAVAQRLQQYQEDFLDHDAAFTELWTLYPGGVPTSLDVVFKGYRLEDGRMGMLCEARAQPENTPETLRSAEALLHTSVMISLYDMQGEPLYCNPAARASHLDSTVNVHQRFANQSESGKLMAQLQKSGGCRRSARVRTKKGIRWHEITGRECIDAVTGERAFLFSEIDISDLKDTEKRVRYLADHDVVTGLPNRNYVRSTMPEELKVASEKGRSLSFLIVDLDHFKTVNDTLGHAAGDELLIQVGNKLSELTGDKGTVARFGGDEFLICLQECDDVEKFCSGLLEQFSEETVIENNKFLITLSIGVSRFPEDGQDLSTLLKNADVALYEAKDRGRNTHRRFCVSLRSRIEKQVSLENDLRRAVEEQEFEVYYQPRLDVASNTIVGAEALLRWRHPTRGLLTPGSFISTCEQNGLITEIGEWVLERVGLQQSEFARDGYPIALSVNLSPRQFKSRSLVDSVLSLSDRTGCDPKQIELEITESMLMSSDDTVTDLLCTFKDRGFGIAIDDFGTGYSNLAYIQRYPITSLKIDRSFVSDISNNGAVTQLVLSLTRLLGIKAVAEGVETLEQLEWLRSNKCEEYQGYLYSPAVPADEFRQMLIQPKPVPAKLIPFARERRVG
ncbi:MAG: EAL domain-containing protein [Pseudomonadota bacterium]